MSLPKGIVIGGALVGGGLLLAHLLREEKPAPAPQPMPHPAPQPAPVAKIPAKVGATLAAIKRDLADLKTRAAKAAWQSQAFKRGFSRGAQAVAARLPVAPVVVDASREDLDRVLAAEESMPGDDDTDPSIVEFEE